MYLYTLEIMNDKAETIKKYKKFAKQITRTKIYKQLLDQLDKKEIDFFTYYVEN